MLDFNKSQNNIDLFKSLINNLTLNREEILLHYPKLDIWHKLQFFCRDNRLKDIDLIPYLIDLNSDQAYYLLDNCAIKFLKKDIFICLDKLDSDHLYDIIHRGKYLTKDEVLRYIPKLSIEHQFKIIKEKF